MGLPTEIEVIALDPRPRDIVGAALLVAFLVTLVVLATLAGLPS